MKVTSRISNVRRVLLAMVSISLLTATLVHAQIGGVDSGFNPAAILNGAVPGVVRAVLPLSDGKVIIAGDFTSIGGEARGRIARLNADGTLDTGFAAGAGADAPVNAVAFYTSGRFVIGGEFQNVDGVARRRVAVLGSTGVLDTSFNSSVGANDAVHALAVVSSSIYIGGDFTQVNGTNRGRLARLSSTGALDSWNTGAGANATVHALLYHSSLVQVIAGGAFTTFNGQPRIRLAAVSTSSGTLSSTFSTGGPDGTVRALVLPTQSFGSTITFIMGGDFLNVGAVARSRLALVSVSTVGSATVTVDGSLSISLDGAVRSLSYGAASSYNRLLIGGDFASVEGQARNRIVRVSQVASSQTPGAWELDTAFNTPAGANAPVRAVALTSDGKSVIGGEFSAIAGTATQSVARLYSDAGSQPPATPGNLAATGVSTSQVVVTFNGVSFATGYKIERSTDGGANWSLAVQQTAPSVDSGFAAGASILYRVKATNSNGDSAPTAAVGATTYAVPWTGAGSLDPASPAPGTNGTVNAIVVQADGRMLIAGSFSTVQGVARANIARLLPDWTVDPSFDPGTGPNSTVRALAIQQNGRIVIVGSFSNVAGTPRKYVARLMESGALDPSFAIAGSGPSSTVMFVGLQPSGRVIIGGDFSTISGTSRPYLARLHVDGTIDSTFTAAGESPPDVFAVQRDGSIVLGGYFFDVNGFDTPPVTRLLPDGAIDPSFNIGSVGSFVDDIALLNNGKALICGWFTNVNGITRNRVARINADGSLDSSFDPGIGPDSIVDRVVPQPDGKVVIGGSFMKVGGVLRPHIARLNADGSLDATFDPGAGTFGTINALAIAPDTRIVAGGSFSSFGTGSPVGLARMLGDGWSAVPPAPVNLAAAPLTSSSLLVTWGDLPAEQGWKLERSPDGSTNWMQIAVLPWDITTFTDTGLSAATSYYYRLRATNGAGDSSYSANAAATTLSLFQQWKLDNGLPLAAADTSDDDGDGIALLAEYGLGLDPTFASADGVPVGQVIGDVMALSYRKYRSDVSYLVEASSDMETWSALGVNQGSGSFPIAWKVAAGMPQLYLRLRVSRP